MSTPTAVAEIDLSAISHNLRLVKKQAAGASVMAVVKADAYGHGLVPVSRHLVRQGVSALGVAFASEGMTLRDAGIKVPIIVFFDRTHLSDMIEYDLTPVIFDLKTARALSREARKRNRLMKVHLKIDTGMGRVGLDIRRACREIARIANLENIRSVGLMSHFSDAELEDKDFAHFQLESFITVRRELKTRKLSFPFFHLSNSAAVLTMPEAHLNMVRPGIMLYGYGHTKKTSQKRALSIRAPILLLKKVPRGTSISYNRTFITKRACTIATIPVGYADGFSRRLSNYGEVIIQGKRAPVVGRVCMDTFMVDVTNIPHVSDRSEALIMGKKGKEEITAEDIARKTGTISYEVLTSVGARIERVYR